MTIKALLPAILPLAVSTCLLAACSGGGGMVRTGTISAQSLPPVAPSPAPAPSGALAGPCPSPVTADCVVVAPYALTFDEYSMTGGRQSDHALVVSGNGWLNLKDGDYRFAGGTTILEDASLVVWNNLTSDVHVTGVGTGGSEFTSLMLGGTLNGDLTNDGQVSLRHLCGTGLNLCVEDHHPVIHGNFAQSASAQLDVVLGWALQISGSAAVDGRLDFLRGTSQSYVLPSAPASVLVLHADHGVSGQFVAWLSNELFLTGNLRYLPNDIYFDVTSLSAAQVMSVAGAGALTVQSAAHFDAALDNAGQWAQRPAALLSTAQRQFLASAGAIQHLRDVGQAARTLDSLSGHGYAAATDALLQQAASPAPELLARLGNLHESSASGPWSAPMARVASAAGAFSGERTGFDQWLSDRLLLGSSFSWSGGSLRFDHSGGAARDQSPQWDMYWRRNGNGSSYVLGDVGYNRHQLNFNRQIDLGGTPRAVGARLRLDMLRAYLETGRDFRVGQAWLTPFGALNYATLRGAGFTEQGSTGFELIAQPSLHQRFTAAAGLRLGADWRRSGGRWTTLNVTAGFRRLLQADDAARVAFTGTPAVMAALDGMPRQRNSGWLQMNLATGGAHWNGLLSYDRQAGDQAVSVGATFKF